MSRATHEVTNVVDELRDVDLYAADAALQEAVAAGGADWSAASLGAYGAWAGSGAGIDLADACNRHPPELHAFDARGRRIDRVEFHPSWHALLARYRAHGLVSLPFSEGRSGRWTAFAAGFYLHGQLEAGTLCPATMTLACIPVLQKEPALWAALESRLFSTGHDPRDVPAADKASIWIGMGMTEKQGGSDVRSQHHARRRRSATAAAAPSTRITGHKWFFSAPMCDAHLVAGAAPTRGLSCFFVPRWRPDGSRNARAHPAPEGQGRQPLQLQQRGRVRGRRGACCVGEEGRGIPTIIEMATLHPARLRARQRRHDAPGAGAGAAPRAPPRRLRPAAGRAAADAQRAGRPGARKRGRAAARDAPRRAFEQPDRRPSSAPGARSLTPAAKFWICKRAVELTGEAMEVFGGNGYVDDGVMGRLYREAPVNSIWEGSGNVMCLDVLRAIGRDPAAADALLVELGAAAADDAVLAAEARALGTLLTQAPEVLEARGRELAQRLVLLAQAGLLRATAPSAVADAFVATRFGAPNAGRVVGAIDSSRLDVEAILERAFPA